MPRATPDEGVKPFEFRVGIGGMPVLGGMFRAGDPATIPPHKFHLLINVRITPSGMTNRPGLALEYDTGVEECIDGLTGVDEPGATMLLWPGAIAFNQSVQATFRKISPRAIDNASEFEIVTLEAPNAQYGETTVLSPPISTYGATPGADAWPYCEPFFFLGKLCTFDYQRDTDPFSHPTPVTTLSYRIIEIVLPKESGLPANNCRRLWRWDGGTPCPAASDTTGQLWPRGEPFGGVQLITNLPDAYVADKWMIESFFVDPERDDDPLTADVGIHEFLYVLLVGRPGSAEDGERRLLKYTGATWLLEYTLPDDLLDNVALGPGRYGPILVASSGTSDWSAYRDAAGVWQAIAGMNTMFTAGSYTQVVMAKRGISARGLYGVVIKANKTLGIGNADVVEVVHQDSITANEMVTGFCVQEDESLFLSTLWDWVQIGDMVYALTGAGVVSNAYSGSTQCGGIVLAPVSNLGGPLEQWIQEIGGRVFLGGKFTNYDVAAQSSDPGTVRHGVYDVTDQNAIETMYEVFATEQTEDEVSGRYSLGCLPAFPNQGEDEDF